MSEDVVTKYALQNEIPLATILNSVDITLETRSLARLTGHKFITDAVQSFRNKYPDWKFSLTELLNELGSNYKTKKKKQNGEKISKVKTREKSEILETNYKNIIDVEDTPPETRKFTESKDRDDYEINSNKSSHITLDVTQTGISLDKKISIDNISNGEVKNNNLNSIIFKKKTINPEKNIDLRKCDSIIQFQQEEINVLNTQLLNSNLPINTGINNNIVIKEKPDQIILCNTDFKKKCVTDDIKPICETVDSFFMTTDDKDYMSVYKPPPAVEKNLVEGPKLEYQKPKEIFIKGKKLIIGKKCNIGNRRERRQQVDETVDTVLHPSWEAKRKQKSLVKFEGKKIIFDD